MTEQKRVLVGCPITSYKKDAMPHYLKGLKGLTYKNKEIVLVDNSPDEEMFKGLLKEKWLKVEKSAHLPVIRDMIVRDRNRLREIALEEDFDYFFSLEQDVVPPRDVIERLLANGKDVSSAVYFSYKEVQMVTPKGRIRRHDLAPIAYTWSDPVAKHSELQRRITFSEVFPSRLQQIHTCGVGCVLISRNVLEKVRFRYEKNAPSFDDMFFCMDCQGQGFEIWLDSRIVCMHHFGGLAKEVVERF